MQRIVIHRGLRRRGRGVGGRGLAFAGLLLLGSSCVPAVSSQAPLTIPRVQAGQKPIPASSAAQAPAAALAPLSLPASQPIDVAEPFILSASSIAEDRSHNCMTQALYYEAASEGEEGMRAVAQVVLNRLRHPAFAASVCGVVYQGPVRQGGGCQFSFTCDGSLMRVPAGAEWRRARRIAAEALAGRVFAPVGLATFYHAYYVNPAWAARMTRLATVGAHIFYRVPGSWNDPSAFSQRHAGWEPLAVPARMPIAKLPEAVLAAMDPPSSPAAARLIEPAMPDAATDALPQSTVRPEYARSGAVREAFRR
jgi:spore germination cell wall hydrolase CwlJ-like protein